MTYDASRAGKSGAATPDLNDRANYQFARLLPAGNTTVQQLLAPAGPYHVNHFICYFTITGKSFTEAQGLQTAGLLTFAFLRNFCFIFSEHNIARAQIGSRGLDDFDGSQTVEFTIGSNVGTVEHRGIGFLHPDWVAMSARPPVPIDDIEADKSVPLRSFHGDTLKRLWSTEVEKKVISSTGSGKSSSTFQALVAELLPEGLTKLLEAVDLSPRDLSRLLDINRQHFLAGTRSWRVGYDGTRKQFYVETITIERYSCRFYQVADSVHSTRQDVLTLWDNLLNNFVKTEALPPHRFTPVDPPAPLRKLYGYKPSGILNYIMHNAWEFPDVASLKDECKTGKKIPAMKTLKDAHSGLWVHVKN